MGMFDSYTTKCPKCGAELTLQSKSGACMLYDYTDKDLEPAVAIGLNGDIIECQFCQTNFEAKCHFPKVVKVDLIETKREVDYPGNHNSKLRKNIEAAKRLKEICEK